MLLVINAQHSESVLERKTDVAGAKWISDLLCHGLVEGSFNPDISTSYGNRFVTATA